MLKNVCLQILNAAEKKGLKSTITKSSFLIRLTDILCRRWWIPILSVSAVVLMILLSGECREISIIGNETLSEFTVCEFLEENGICTENFNEWRGVFGFEIESLCDTRETENDVFFLAKKAKLVPLVVYLYTVGEFDESLKKMADKDSKIRLISLKESRV